jgi:uncharacterized protein (TIGR02391 family)
MEAHKLPDASAVIEMPVDELAMRLLRLAAHHQQGHLLSRSNATAPGHWEKHMTANQAMNAAFLRSIGEAWDWLRFRGLISNEPQSSSDWTYITARGHALANDANGLPALRADARLDVDLHPRLQPRVSRQFVLGEYELAAFAAMREVEIRLRSLSGASESDIGVNLAKQALKPGGPLANPKLDRGEQEATMALFWGALGVFKNPPSHRQVEYDDPTLASEVILLADLLLRMLDVMAPFVAYRRAEERVAAVRAGKTLESSGGEQRQTGDTGTNGEAAISDEETTSSE